VTRDFVQLEATAIPRNNNFKPQLLQNHIPFNAYQTSVEGIDDSIPESGREV
jgi:hypothetical protein